MHNSILESIIYHMVCSVENEIMRLRTCYAWKESRHKAAANSARVALCALVRHGFDVMTVAGKFKADEAAFIFRGDGAGVWYVDGGQSNLYPSRFYAVCGVFASDDEANAAMLADDSLGVLRVTSCGLVILAKCTDHGISI